MEERQPAPILGHEHEARRDDRVGDPEPGPEALGELRLSRAQLTDQADQVPRPRDRRQRRTQGTRSRRVARHDDPFQALPCNHSGRLPETRSVPHRAGARAHLTNHGANPHR